MIDLNGKNDDSLAATRTGRKIFFSRDRGFVGYLAVLLVVLPLVTVLAVSAVLVVSHASAEEFKSGSSGNISFELRPLPQDLRPGGSLGVELTLSDAKSDMLEPQISALEQPTRLVVDLPGSVTNSKTIKLGQYGVAAIRFGRHPDRARVVLDFQGAEPLTFRLARDSDKKSITVTVTGGGSGTEGNKTENTGGNTAENAAANRAKKPTETQAENNVESGAEFDTAPAEMKATGSEEVASSAAVESSIAASSSSSVRPAPVQPALAAPEVIGAYVTRPKEASASSVNSSIMSSVMSLGQTSSHASSIASSAAAASRGAETNTGLPSDGGSVVRGLTFQRSEKGSGVIVIDVSNLTHYSVTRAQDNVFEVVLEGARIGGNHLELPQFPPDYFEGLEVVRARNRNRDVVIELYVEDAIRVNPYVSKGQLYIGLGY